MDEISIPVQNLQLQLVEVLGHQNQMQESDKAGAATENSRKPRNIFQY